MLTFEQVAAEYAWLDESECSVAADEPEPDDVVPPTDEDTIVVPFLLAGGNLSPNRTVKTNVTIATPDRSRSRKGAYGR